MDLEQQFAADRVEARSVAFTDVDASNDGWTFEGYAAVYGQEADLGEFTESISRGAFRKALPASGNIPMLYDHNPMLPVLATTGGETLRLSEDAKGLRVKADLAKHYMGEAVRELVQRGDIRGMSFGFVAGAGNSRLEQRGNKPHRDLLNFKKILDVSPTWDPAYEGTNAELRSLRALQMADDIDQVQRVLSGAVPQLEDGAPVDEPESVDQDDTASVCEQCSQTGCDCEPVAEVVDEQRSGVEAANAESAARRRRLQMMGISIPNADITASMGPDEPGTRRRPLRDIDDLLGVPRETWSVEEQRSIRTRVEQVQKELFAIADKAERAGRNLNADEASEFDQLQNQFRRLCR